MDDVFKFINNGLRKFSDNDGIYDKELKNECLSLNKLLNETNGNNYKDYLIANCKVIKRKADIIFSKMQSNIYTNLNDVLSMLFYVESDKEMFDNDNPQKNIRDHYFHSLQCFLLSLTLYPVLAKQTKKTLAPSKITGTLFSMSMYHDIGYLYKANKEKINESIHEILFGRIEFNRDKLEKLFYVVLKDMIQPYKEKSETRSLFEKIKNQPELKIIWKNVSNNFDTSLLYEIARVNSIPPDCQHHHSYMSAVFLQRILQTIRIIRDCFDNNRLPGTFFINNPDIDEERNFVEIIRAILFHDFNMGKPITLESEFLSSLLMIIDEIQTYGRLPQNAELYDEILDPKYVMFEWINRKTKLVLSYNKTYVESQNNTSLSEAYRKHNNKKIVENLKSKVDLDSLKILIIDS